MPLSTHPHLPNQPALPLPSKLKVIKAICRSDVPAKLMAVAVAWFPSRCSIVQPLLCCFFGKASEEFHTFLTPRRQGKRRLKNIAFDFRKFEGKIYTCIESMSKCSDKMFKI
jgi:hypothetical protein